MIKVPQSTVDKPLTAIDYIACLEFCDTICEVAEYADRVPLAVWSDQRFATAVAKRLQTLRRQRP